MHRKKRLFLLCYCDFNFVRMFCFKYTFKHLGNKNDVLFTQWMIPFQRKKNIRKKSRWKFICLHLYKWSHSGKSAEKHLSHYSFFIACFFSIYFPGFAVIHCVDWWCYLGFSWPNTFNNSIYFSDLQGEISEFLSATT